MTAVPVEVVSQQLAGHWLIRAHPRHGRPIDITTFRGLPTGITSMGFADPFGPSRAQLAFPQVTYFDRLGEGDLSWLREFTTIEVRWYGALPATYPHGKLIVAGDGGQWWHPRHVATQPALSWLGRISSFSWAEDGLRADLQGMFHSLDDFLAKPEYPSQPMPYEWAIARQFLHHPSLRLQPLTIVWPTWWSTRYTPPPKGTPRWMIPTHVVPGRFWTGLLTRETGRWDPVGTSYLQTLLASMYTRRGRWTVDIFDGGKPVLMHRDILDKPNSSTVVIDMTGVNTLRIDQDWTQSLGVVYAQGQALNGEAFTGMNVSPDGSQTRYEPMASLRQVHPETPRHNEWFDPTRPRREIQLSMQQGIDELGAQQVSAAHLERFAHPGVTGTVVLHEDPTINGVSLPRMLVRAGMTVWLPGVLGTGLLAHVVENTVDWVEETNTLTIDTKFRDQLTVREVRMRGRDALAVPRMLAVGQWQPPVPDQLVPWSYREGSGFIPTGSTELFADMPADLNFPWESWTRAHPPRKARWRHAYIRIPAVSTNASKNWAWVAHGASVANQKLGQRFGIPIRLAQAGDVRLLQLAAYDDDGNVLPVRFHASLYNQHGVNVLSMPLIPAKPGGGSDYPPYAAHQRYPFVRNGWNQYKADGTLTNPNIAHPTDTVGLIRGWGDYYEPAGYWPGSKGGGGVKTGLLVSEDRFHFETVQSPNVFDPYKERQPKWAGLYYLMIYCDDQGTRPVHFMGRIYRVEPGQA